LNAATSAAAITAAINIDANGEVEASRNRRSNSSRTALAPTNRASYPSPPSSLPQHHSLSGTSYGGKAGSDATDEKGSSKARGRRASEASALTKKKSASGELKCETCGKGYKHSSCLTKHLLVLPHH